MAIGARRDTDRWNRSKGLGLDHTSVVDGFSTKVLVMN